MENQVYDLNIKTAGVLPQYRNPSFEPRETTLNQYRLGTVDLVVKTGHIVSPAMMRSSTCSNSVPDLILKL